nr:methionine biosynthesis protein MetW [Nocardia bovistercoris]
MRGLYGRHYGARYRAIADLIPDGASVVDLCCGPATLYTGYLRERGVEYTGLDLNAGFVARLNASGGTGAVWNMHSDEPLPTADYVLMQASLYHFLPDPAPVLNRMLAAARKQVIIAEPVRNLASSDNKVLAAVARRFTDAGEGAEEHRFTETSLDAFLDRYADRVEQRSLIAGGREKLYVLSA